MTETLFPMPAATRVSAVPAQTALEVDFPAEAFSHVGLVESWRKEVHRPATSTHKWWAKRLGTVFRGIITSAVAADATEALRLYSSRTSLPDLVILDPFGGSGITAVEALKLGARVISFDINPVATLVQRQAVQPWDELGLAKAYKDVEAACRTEIDRVHRTADGRTVLYYFWVRVADCPDCAEPVRLFSSPVFSRHAYPKRVPKVQVVCPICLDIQEDLHGSASSACANGHVINPQGAVKGSVMTCGQGHISKVKTAIGDEPPRSEMYAKMVVDSKGNKTYEGITAWDRALYAECEILLSELPPEFVLPDGKLAQGNNTNQALGWNFREWRDFFNARQLYSLSLLATAISQVRAAPAEREALCALFSGTLEFNNMFCSFKGEGTGAVRHMFAHHILKPERTPLEAHPWGTPQSSGSFSTLLKSRLYRAHEYKKNPVDLVLRGADVERIKGISQAVESPIATSFDSFKRGREARAYITTRNAAFTDLPDESVDLVVTDPPYMDNVHYAELADFFHAWLQKMRPYETYSQVESTRAEGEVQQADPEEFGKAIESVWTECARALKPGGLVAFTFHQARIHGWIQLIQSLKNSGLRVTAIQPVKGEMATSMTKTSAKEPSNLDSVVVCRKTSASMALAETLDDAFESAVLLLNKLIEEGVDVGAGDIRSVVRGSLLSFLAFESEDLGKCVDEVDLLADRAILEISKVRK